MPIAEPGTGFGKKKRKPHSTAHSSPDTVDASQGNPPGSPSGGVSNSYTLVETRRRRGVSNDRRYAPPAWVVSRQRTLKANGFAIRVDGQWGARSQAAWEAYLARKRVTADITRRTRSLRQSQLNRVNQLSEIRGKASAGAALARNMARIEAAKRSTHRHALLVGMKARVQTNAANERGFIPRNAPASVQAQDRVEAVRGQHRKDELVRQILDARRFKALDKAAELRRLMRLEALTRRMHVRGPREVVKGMNAGDLYDLLFSPYVPQFNPEDDGQVRIVQQFLSSHGHKDVKVNGVYTETTHNALVATFREAREREQDQQRQALVENFYKTGVLHSGAPRPDWFPLGDVTPNPGQLLTLLRQGGFSAAVVWKALSEQLDRPDVKYLHFRMAQFEKMADDLRGSFDFDPNHRIIPRSKIADLLTVLGGTADNDAAFNRVHAMLNARTFAEFKTRLQVIERQEEMNFRLDQYDRAQKQANVWWRQMLEPVAWAARPGQWLRTELVAEAMWMHDDPAGFWRYVVDPTYHHGEGGDILDQYRRRGEQEIAEMPWYTRLPFEIAVDPLILAGPIAKGVWGVSRGGMMLMGRGAMAMGRSEALISGSARFSEALEAAGSRAYKLGDESFGLPALQTRITRTLAEPGADAGYGLRAASHVYRRAKHATRIKAEFTRAAHARVQWAMRHGFAAVSPEAKKAMQLADEAIPEFKMNTSRTRELLDSSREEIRQSLPAVFPSLVRALHAEQASIWLDAGRRGLSTFGASLRARLAEEFRNQEVHRLATVFSQQRYSEFMAKHGWEKEFRGQGLSLAGEEYNRVRAAAGLYTRGSADPELRKMIDRKVFALMDKFDQAVFPALQDTLEEMAEKAGLRLFDDAGLWVGREGALQALIKKMALASFDPDNVRAVANPMHNVPVPPEVAEELIEGEVRRLQSRLEAWYAREVAAGRIPFSKKELDDRLGKIAEEVRDAWKPVTVDGQVMVQDTRVEVEESGLYARHLDESLEVNIHPDDDIDGWLAKMQEIAMPFGTQAIDREIGEVAWMLGGGHGLGPGQIVKRDPTARRFPVPERDKVRQAQANTFKQAVLKRQIALGRAYDEAMGQAFYQEGAKFQALLHAQSRPFTALRWAVKAELSVWLFATLPLRMAWPVRNLIDNTVKSFIEGVRNPSAYFPESDTLMAATRGAQAAERGTKSVFDVGLVPLREMARGLDRVFGTRVAESLEAAYETFWMHENRVLQSIFERHAIPVPEEALDAMTFRPFHGPTNPRILNAEMDDVEALALNSGDDQIVADAEKLIRKTPDELAAERSKLERARDYMWELMGERPENFSRRVVYRDTYYKAIKAGKSPLDAWNEALAKVERTLFDYSKVTMIEDNMRFFLPFVQYWRKNFGFWIRTSFQKPVVPLAIARYEQERDLLHADQPEWMRRYISSKDVSDAIAVVPGMDWLADSVDGLDFSYDPLNFLSFAPLYRSFKAENPDLPADQAGWRFLAPFVDGLSDWGLGLNPFVRKPLEHAGVLNHRAWQTVFPQTPMMEAFTRRYIGDKYADFIHDFDSFVGDPLFTTLDALLHGERPSDFTQASLDQWTMMEVTNQVARGEQPDEEKARRKVEFFFLVQSLTGYFAGAYIRRSTPEDIYLYKLEDSVLDGDVDFRKLSDKDKELYRLWRLRKADRLQWEAYVEMLPMIRAYYAQPDYASKEALKQANPEIIPYVEPIWTTGRIASSNYVRDSRLAQDTDVVMQLSELTHTLKLDRATRSLADQALVTPELRAWWAENDTPTQRRDRMLRGLYYRHVSRMNDLYHAIPATDYDAKDGFLADHPELIDWWNANNTDADDYKAIINSVLADLRERYFEYADDQDWDGANAFLARFPFVFDSFKGDTYTVDRETGRSEFSHSTGMFGGGSFSGRSQSQHARDYLKAKRWLDLYFSLPHAEQLKWLRSDAQGASIVRSYFDRYASKRSGGRGGMSEHARDYAEAKDALTYYFSLPKEKRDAWLKAGSPEAKTVLAYFKKYGKTNRLQRAFEGDSPLLHSRNAELRERLRFWQRYFTLTPDQRPLYVQRHAEDSGVFVYGVLGSKERKAREAEWMRRAYANGQTQRSAHYLYVKPLLDLFFTLGKEEKSLFLRANPEVQEYLDNYSRSSATGDSRLDGLVERYFKLPSDSQARSLFLRQHPEVQHYFNAKSTPAERAMRNLLNVYFEIRDPRERKVFLTKHPEIQDYFDQRRRERDLETTQLRAFDDADPRLRPFFDFARRDVGGAAERFRLARRGPGVGLAFRRDRQI